MKLFGKRKKPSATLETNAAAAATPVKEAQSPAEDEKVFSYFSSDFNPLSSTGTSEKKEKVDHDIEKLLAMDPSTLNAKQRRVVRRHQQRTEKTDSDMKPEPAENNDEDMQEKQNSETSKVQVDASDEAQEKNNSGEFTSETSQAESITKENETETETKTIRKETVEDVAQQLKGLNSKERRKMLRKLSSDYDEDFLKQATELSKDSPPVSNGNSNDDKTESSQEDKSMKSTEGKQTAEEEVAEQLKGLNSKERRKLLRKLASEYDESFLEKVTEVSKQIAEENVSKQSEEQQKAESSKRKLDESAANASQPDTSKKTKKEKDFSHLPPEERARREKQREMQKAAAARRAAGEVLTRHPLNSERRRANRRKPGRAGKIAIMKKEMKEKQQNLKMFNASGYTMRLTKKNEK